MKTIHKLTNRNIKEQYSNTEFYLMKKEILGTFVSWLIQQSPYDMPNITKVIKAYDKFLSMKFDTIDTVRKFTYKELSDYISSDVFESIPEIEKFNNPKTKADYDFVSLGALSSNIFYDICRSHITQPL